MVDRNHCGSALRPMILLVPLCWGLGCAWVRGPSGPGMDHDELAGLPKPDTLHVEASADTASVEPTVAEPTKPRIRRDTTTPTPPPPSAETIGSPRVDISVQMTEEERSQLEQEARGRILQTNQILGGLDSSSFSQAKQDALLTVKGLVASAGAALNQGDVQAADSLARKALLLATDLAPK